MPVVAGLSAIFTAFRIQTLTPNYKCLNTIACDFRREYCFIVWRGPESGILGRKMSRLAFRITMHPRAASPLQAANGRHLSARLGGAPASCFYIPERGNSMKITKMFRETAAVLALLGVSAAAHADLIYKFNVTEAAFGTGPYGTVTVTEVAGDSVKITVDLNSYLDFVNTGNSNSKALFSFRVANAVAGDVNNIVFQNMPVGAVVTASNGGTNDPYKNFTIALDCTTNCGNGGGNGIYEDPLTFYLADAHYGDFTSVVLANN